LTTRPSGEHEAAGTGGWSPVPGPLDGIRVVDLTTILMGPLAARILGDLGADVIRIESLAGDSVRNSQPARHDGMASMALNLHRNKRSIALDLKHPDGRDAALALMATVDVVVTNMRRSALDRLGLGPEAVRASSPGLIYCVANGYGSDGPYAARPAYDDAIQAASGLAWLVGQVQDRPGYLPTIVADKVCGMTIAQAVLAALVHRGRSGEGQTIEVPMLETMVAFNLIEHQRGHIFDPPVGRLGYERVLSPYRRPYRTCDGWICLMPYTDAHWREFFSLAGRPELADDARFAGHNARIRHVDELYALLDELSPQLTTGEWLARCDAASIPAMPVLALDEVEADPHLVAVGLIEHVEHPTEGPYRNVRDSVRYEATPSGLRRHAPRLGQHTEELLAEAGLDRTAIDRLLAAGAAATAGAAVDRETEA
jgi:crotonobetainyl-CoA:carnitine CoA-transferase CaiB-like acyl-CoA transferase